MVMTIEETKQIVDKIKIHRPTFGGQFDKAGLDKLKLEWFRILEPYDFEDVNKKLDDYLKDGDNFGRYPDAYYLTKYLRTHDEKSKAQTYHTTCRICGMQLELNSYQKHYDRCLSANYLCKMSEKYYDKKLKGEKLITVSQEEFDKYYWSFCEKLVEVIEEGPQKHALKNAIFTHYGLEPELNLSHEDLLKGRMLNGR